MTLREFLTAGPRYDRAATSGPAWAVVPISIAIVAAGQLLAFLAFIASAWLRQARTGDAAPVPGGLDIGLQLGKPDPQLLMLFALLSQVAMIALTVLAALRPGVRRALKLGAPEGGAKACLLSVLCMIPVIGALNLAAYLLARDNMMKDFEGILDLARSAGVGTTSLVIGVGAPISEELLFRGYLLSSLAATSLGYWPAALIANAGWALLHFNYSWIGLLEVFAIGIYFAWLLWRTGSLLPALICHALYNGALLVVLRHWPAG